MQKVKLYLFPLIIAIFLVIPGTVQAQENIHSFNVTMTPFSNGQINVKEQIVYDFDSNDRHGIFRIIPLLSQVGNLYKLLHLQVTSVQMDDSSEPYTVSQTGNDVTIKIGNPNQTISGTHSYTIDYTIDNEIVHFQDHDEINWNVTGNDWQVPIASSQFVLLGGYKIIDSTCFTGSAGSTAKNCRVSSPNPPTIQTSQDLKINEGLTVVVGFPANTFPPAKLTTYKPNTFITQLPPTPVLIALGILALIYYLILPAYIFYKYRTTHHKSRLGKVTVNFDFPTDPQGQTLPPAEAGAVDTAQIGKEDVIATIYNFAINKLLVIKQTDHQGKLFGLLPDSITYTLEKVANLPENTTSYERTLFYFLFASGPTINIQSLSSNFYTTFNTFSLQTFQTLVSRGIYSRDPRLSKTLFIAFGIVSLVTLNVLLSILMFYFSRILIGRTSIGEELDWKIDGLKLYLKNMGREFGWQAKELILVEKMIPYAIAFGYINNLMEQIRIHYPNYQPTWYIGRQPFYSVYPSMFNTFSSSIVTTAPQSGSGFSGGGFSGGGGGGGGGGSW